MVATKNISVAENDTLVLVGTMKGAFILRSDSERRNWELGGPYLPGHSVYAMAYDGRRDRSRIWAAQSSMHWGAVLSSSDDFGLNWTEPETAPIRFPESTGASLKQIWQIQLGGKDEPDSIYWCDGSEAEYDRLCQLLIEKGTFQRLNDDKRPNSYIAFSDPAFDESQYARIVASRYKTRHFVDRVESDDFDLIDTLAKLYDEPYADSSAIPTYRVCQLARRHVTVALSGDGGDESFGGYRRYRLHLMEERMRRPLPLALRRPVFGLLGEAYPKADWAPRVFRAKTTLQALARDSVEAYFHSMSLLRDDMRRQLFSGSFKAALDGYNAVDVFRRHAARANHEDPLALIQYLDLKTYLVGDINTKVDRASMAHSLEVREPLMDHPLVEWLATLPSSLKMRGGEGKWFFKRSLEGRLPNDILYRPKMGFAVPLASWFRGPLRARVRSALLGSTLSDTGFFNRNYLEHLVTRHESGARDYSGPIWALLMFESFLRNAAESGQPSHDLRLAS